MQERQKGKRKSSKIRAKRLEKKLGNKTNRESRQDWKNLVPRTDTKQNGTLKVFWVT